ncbi:16S rRNA (cytidine(1402)-2'-O)-methyltransferase [Aquibacillus sp. 3ASR75-11]|uniref:Ribosomal RNA small subunit methyltransferase I n=1 Tax=Terrihalobacillus insolitus TaxID=2950438 RepID=A0A9X3WXG2_9BACI|nr:16S rRNA (cytidine(1402)-2'-O)-methyltransferase [Terrihalobacillus insolitus]MDC3426031.1 16S rRNA (cytidine(1402)-2'-O)-methyltransferase [Terrihalobacillus insolitus]
MQIQNSFSGSASYGTLFVVPTPIGNLEDITIRALHTLKSVSVIAAEDTRNTKRLLQHFEINQQLVSYHEHNKFSREQSLLEKLNAGEDIAIVSDAGMPAISDPGYELVVSAVESGYPVVVLPGANAALCALVGSGLPTNAFYFFGFLPRKKNEKQQVIHRLKEMQSTLLFYESPHRVADTLELLLQVLGDRQVALARELTKRYEEYTRGKLSDIIESFQTNERMLKGEFCIVVAGNTMEETEDNSWWGVLSLEEHVNHYMKTEEVSSKEAIKKVAEERRIPKRDVYKAYHV